jgi:hypothetical protein
VTIGDVTTVDVTIAGGMTGVGTTVAATIGDVTTGDVTTVDGTTGVGMTGAAAAAEVARSAAAAAARS